MNRKSLPQFGILVLGTAVGLGLAAWYGGRVRLNDGRVDLDQYAARLERTATQISQQAAQVINAVLADHLEFCSPQELELMRSLVFRANDIKDIGRIKDGMFVCSSGLGVLDPPQSMPFPDKSFRKTLVYPLAPVMVSKGARAFMVQVKDVDVVLNPRAFENLSGPSKSYGGYFFDKDTGTLLQGFGDTIPLSKSEIMAGKEVERQGVYYHSLCSAEARFCVVAGETRAAMMAGSTASRWMILLAGASIGDTIALAILLFYRRHRSREQQLRRAIRKDELTLVYQPIVDIATGAIIGAEGLVRWTDEEGEIIDPEIFIALAEQKGFVTEITHLVLRRALTELRSLLLVGNFRLTINITSHDLEDSSFFDALQMLVAEDNIPPSALGFELTERSVTNQRFAIEMIARLRQAGYTVYLDDFGTGYSSLAYLRDLAVDAIKIDRAFTATVGTAAITESIIPQILHMAKQLGLAVVVEGIETQEQAAYFRAEGKQMMGQGWFFGSPLPAIDLQHLLKGVDNSH
jgi:sensor c-di-GMP phosphodiesterase-like protein